MSLTVYTASAGSGKTFTLAVEYIKLLITDPYNYRKILAVTFTNKATEEMKMRILSQLYGIWKKLPDSNDYMEKVCSQLGIENEYASKQAGIALYNLLHNYNYFRIETIDSFFQSILRNLARELDLTTNLRLSLNDTQVEQQAVDKLIEDLDARNEILHWIIDYINEKIANDKSWNVINDIKQFGMTIFKDKYKEASKSLSDFMSEKGKYERYVKRLRQEQKEAEETMRHYGELFMEKIDGAGLSVDDFKNKTSGIYGFFEKLSNGVFDESIVGKRVINCSNDPNEWVVSKSPNAQITYSLVVNSLFNLLTEALKERPKQWLRYKSAELTLKHTNQLRLLHVIEKKMRDMNSEANRFMLSDTQHLLQSLIDGSDSPFIFEKTGSHLSHIMIDEFQDTSTVQWKNFKILLLECMSQENSHNLIVGDVKQSIYRWRSGDWRLLGNISGEFGNNSQMVKHVPLDTNYRSQRNIINFNNAFFKVATDLSDVQEIKNAYKEVKQEVPTKKGNNGYVRIELLPNIDYKEETLEKIKLFVEELLDNNVKQRDIAILVRTNDYIPLIADYLKSELHGRDINIVSDEAFKLGSSVAVNIIISALHLLIYPDDKLEKAKLAKAYQKHVKKNQIEDAQLFTESDEMDKWLPETYVADRMTLLRMPLYDLCQHISNIFELDTLSNEGSYMATFNDELTDFIIDKSSDISQLLKDWEDSISGTNIQGTEINGIRMLTIHKSKGLEYENVIMPFCDWQLEKTHGNVLLCKTDKQPFSELPLVPIDYSSKMSETVYANDYLDEHSQNLVDNLNLLYVGLTRAVSNLYVIGKKKARNSRSQLLESCLEGVHKQLPTSVFSNPNDASAIMSFEYGSIYVSEEKKSTDTSNVFLQPATNQGISTSSKKAEVEFRQSNASKHFIDDEGDEEDMAGTYIKIGQVLHGVLSEIKTAADVEGALSRLEHEGVLYDEHITSERIRTMLAKRLEDKRVAEWFSDKWEIFNETTIIFKDPETGKIKERRPDRVMAKGNKAVVVDFKFGKHKDDYKEQVKNYMQLLESMGYTDVTGYLWYVYSNKIVEV